MNVGFCAWRHQNNDQPSSSTRRVIFTAKLVLER